ncbi:MAG: uroporphyrinogen decarboxylase [Pseudomonadota bacterium]
MKKSERALSRVLAGERVDPAPVWFMRQAGRYLPEYRATRKTAGSFLDLCYNPELATEVTLQPIRRFGFDCAILFSDILVIPDALGQDVRFEEGVGPVLEPIRTAEQIAALEPDRVLERLEPVLETVRRVRAALPPEVALIGFAGAPWTLATYVVGGRSSPDHAEAKLLWLRDPEAFERLIRILEGSVAAFLRAQLDAGCDAVKLFDSWAGSAPYSLREMAVVGPAERIAAQLRAGEGGSPFIAFPKGIGGGLAEYAARVRPNAIAIDAQTDPRWAHSVLPEGMAVQGNLDPVHVRAPIECLDAAVADQKAAFADRPHIFNLGHGVTPDTSIDAVARILTLWRS